MTSHPSIRKRAAKICIFQKAHWHVNWPCESLSRDPFADVSLVLLLVTFLFSVKTCCF